jgi:hypothetical protein
MPKGELFLEIQKVIAGYERFLEKFGSILTTAASISFLAD